MPYYSGMREVVVDMATATAKTSDGGVLAEPGFRRPMRTAGGGGRPVASYEDRAAWGRERAASALLTDAERGELLQAWGGGNSVVRSAQGAVEDRLNRAPPREGERLRADLLSLLVRLGGEVERDRLLSVFACEEDVPGRPRGLTKYEARGILRMVLGAGQAEQRAVMRPVDRARKRVRRDQKGVFEPVDEHEAEEEPTPVVFVTEAGRKAVKPRFPEGRSRAQAWEDDDEALRVFCLGGPACHGTHAAGSTLPLEAPGSSPALEALGMLDRDSRRVLEAAYARTAPHPRTMDFGGDEAVARLAGETPACEEVRLRLVGAKLQEVRRNLGREARDELALARDVGRSVVAEDALASVLDRRPAGQDAAKWRAERAAFASRVARQARGMLEAAVARFREARACL